MATVGFKGLMKLLPIEMAYIKMKMKSKASYAVHLSKVCSYP